MEEEAAIVSLAGPIGSCISRKSTENQRFLKARTDFERVS